MAEVLIRFKTPVVGPGGEAYIARACGRVAEDGHRWEGWIEFDPENGSPVLRTPRESIQPNRDDLVYWATGLSEAYLEGAIQRALQPRPQVRIDPEPERPTYEGPAPDTILGSGRSPTPRFRAVLDPFHIYTQGEDVLRSELSALDSAHLRNIIRAYDLLPSASLDLESMDRRGLADVVMREVRNRARG